MGPLGGSDNFLCVGVGGAGHFKKSPETGCHMYMRLLHSYAIIAWLCDKNPGAHAKRVEQGGVGVAFKKKERGGNFFAEWEGTPGGVAGL